MVETLQLPPLHQMAAARMAWPAIAGARDAGELVSKIDRFADSLIRWMPRLLPALELNDAVALSRSLDCLQEKAWRARCLLIGEMWYRLVDLAADRRAAVIGELFEVSREHIWNLVKVWETFGEKGLIIEGQEKLSQAHYIEAAHSPAPERYLRRAADAGLTKRELHAEIAAAKSDRRGTVSEETVPPATVSEETLPATCPTCGQPWPAAARST